MEKKREEFVNKMRSKLALQNYGFKNSAVTYQDIMGGEYDELQPLRELMIRLELYKKLGRDSDGKIDFPKAKSTIYYTFDSQNLGKNVVKILHN